MKQTSFPSTMGVFCPKCKTRAKAIVVQAPEENPLRVQRKYLVPCQHELDEAQEQEIINHVIKHDMKNG